MSDYQYWRLAVDSIINPTFVVTGIQYFKVSTTAGGTSIFTGGTASASSEYSASNAAARAFDDDGTHWSNAISAFPAWVQYDRGAGNAAGAAFLELRAYPPNPGYSPKLMRLQGSNDGATWTELLSVNITGYATSDAYVIDSLGTLRIPFGILEPPLPPPDPPPALVSKGVSLIIHTQPIRQIGTNTAFDLAQPRHNCDVITGPLRSTIGGENDNISVSFAAGDQLQTAMLAANGARMVMYNDGVIEFDGTINSARFEPGFVQITGAA